ncbi:hypothetical protein VE03_07689 [Pseudogymnoascus sp. 23342-1-I1]|nr:hypothetical protein VE03_07689 [Pseudogymnoascus sp. 23342-1-I1]
MAGDGIPHGPGSSPQSLKPPATTTYTKPPQNAEAAAKERRKRAAAKALATQARLRSESLQQSASSVNKTTKVPRGSQESPNISPAKSPHTSGSGCTTIPVDAGPVTNASPKKLSPSNYANIGARFGVRFLTMQDGTMKCDGPGYMSKSIFLEWDGIDREALKVVNGDKECLFIEFGTIQRVSYNPTSQHLQLIFKTTTEEELQTVVIAMNALPSEEWVQLQQLFRQVEKKWRIGCDQEDTSFFNASIKSMRKKPYKKMETPCLNRSDTATQNAAEKLPPRRSSVPITSQRQSVRPNLGITSKVSKTPKIKSERPKAHLSVEIKNIMAAKVIDQPLRIPRLSTPSKSASNTSNLMSRISQSPLKEEIESQRRTSLGYSDRDSPTKRSIGSQNRSRFSQPSATPKRDVSPHGISSLFGSDDSDNDLSIFKQPDKTPSQRFNDKMNEAKMMSSNNLPFSTQLTFGSLWYIGSQLSGSPESSPNLFARSSGSIMRDQSTQEPEKPEYGFEDFISNIQGSNQIGNDLDSSSSNIRDKRNRSPSPPELLHPFNVTAVKLDTKPLQNADQIAESDHPSRKLKGSHAALENEVQFYYQCKSGQDFLLPVAVNDEVIRLRTKNEMEESGKQSKYDIFDGPWVVLGISETSFPLSSDFFVLGGGDPDSTASRQAKWNKMLTTKIRLDFPEGSMADPWVEISRLLPVIDPIYITTGTPVPSSSEVSTHTSYPKLVEKLCAQPVAPGSQNSFVKKSSSDAVDDELYVVEIRKGTFAVFMDIDHKGVGPDSYEVAKIRQKRLRLYTKAEAKQIGATQYADDKWVKRLLMQHGDIAQNKLIVDEYLCSWAGWAVEDQTWVPRGNFGSDALLRLFDELNDPFRDLPDDIVVPVEDLVYKDGLKSARASLKKGKRSSSESNGRSSGSIARKSNMKRGTARRIMR